MSTIDDPRKVHDTEEIHTLRDAARVFFSRPGPRIIAATAASCWALRVALGPPGPLDVVAAGAAVAWWPFQEWVMHKHLLHMRPRTIAGRTFDPLFARKHRAHHGEPRSVDGTLLPVSVIVGAIPGAAVGLTALFGLRRATVTAMATYSTMALAYEWTHLLVHSGYKPKGAYGRRVRRNHRLHHFRNESYWFAFIAPMVDRALGTEPDPSATPVSKTARDLFGIEARAAAEKVEPTPDT